MAKDGISAALSVRSSTGLEVWSSPGLDIPYSEHPEFPRDASKSCRAAIFSPDGRYLAWINGVVVQICSTANWSVLRSLPRPKACYLKFSPLGNYLMTYEMFFTTKDCPTPSPNLFVYDLSDGSEVYSIIQKKQTGWEPVWSQDESIMALMIGGEAFFFEPKGTNQFAKHSKKVGSTRNCTLSVGPNTPSPFVAFCMPGTKGGPSQCKIYRYPDLQASQPIAFRSFYQADSVEMLWNKRGNGLLLLTSTDVDQTGASYYGKQSLHFMSTRGDTYSVQLSKEGSVHAVSWNPNSSEFCVVYGFMPAKATFYNLKCDATFEAGEGDRNSIYYNGFGNLVILAGFGNLNGSVEIWDVQNKKIVSTIRAFDTTLLEWCPNGELFVTATTSPRLRVSNCFKVWHYSGSLLHETLWPTGQELYEVAWQRFPDGAFQPMPISKNKVNGIKSSQPQASSEPYRPPGARGLVISTPPVNKSSPASNGVDSNSRKDRRTERNKQRALNFRMKSENGAEDPSSVSAPELCSLSLQNNNINNATTINDKTANSAKSTTSNVTMTAEEVLRIKRQRIVAKKLNDIAKLKQRKDKGEHLEINQLSKISSEDDLKKELAELKRV